MADRTTFRIFVASSNELKEEREKCIFLFNKIGKLFKHLHLEPVHWEYDVVHSTYPNLKEAQKEINNKLKECQLVIFLFYSRIGKYTFEEFRLANKLKKESFIFFKTGFSPKTEQLESFGELRKFLDSLNGKALPIEYADYPSFEQKLTDNLNLHLSEKYQSSTKEALTALSQTNQDLVRRLGEKDKEIKELKEAENQLPTDASKNQLQELMKEREHIRRELLKSEEIKNQLAKDKEALEKQLAPQIEKDELKRKAFDEVKKGNYFEAENFLRESAKTSLDETASTFFELAKIKKLQLQYSEALQYYELAAKVNPNDSLYLNNAGSMAEHMGYYNKAIEYYEKALNIDMKIHGKNHPFISVYYNNIGSANRKKGEHTKAIKYFELALAIDKKLYGEDHPEISVRYNNIGLVHYYRGEYDKAIQYYEKAIGINNKFLKEDHPQIAKVYNNIGLAYNDKGEYYKAIQFYEKGLSINKKMYGKEHPEIAKLYNNIGGIYNDIGEFNKAIEYFELALAIDKKYMKKIILKSQFAIII